MMNNQISRRHFGKTFAAGATALALTSALAFAATSSAQAAVGYGCLTKQGTALSVSHTWDTSPTTKLGYKNTFTATGKTTFVAVNGMGNGTTAVVYTSKNGTKATVRLFASVSQWCDISVRLRTK